MPARTSAVHSHAGLTFAICCKAGAGLSLTLCFSGDVPVLRLAMGLCLCWQEAGAAAGGVEGTASCTL